MFDHYCHLPEATEIDRMENILIPYSNTPLSKTNSGTNTNPTTATAAPASSSAGNNNNTTNITNASTNHSSSGSRGSPMKRSVVFNSLIDFDGPSPAPPSAPKPSSKSSRSMPSHHDPAFASSLANANAFRLITPRSKGGGAVGGRNSPSSGPGTANRNTRSTTPADLDPDLEGLVAPAPSSSATTSSNPVSAPVTTTKKSAVQSKYQLSLDLEAKEKSEFFFQNYGYKLAMEQLSTILSLLLKWNSKKNQESQDKVTTTENATTGGKEVIIQSDFEGNELLTIELLKNSINANLAKCKNLYKQNAYYNNMIKELSKEMIVEMKKSDTLYNELIEEIIITKWHQNTLPGKYQEEIEILKERLIELKKEHKIWEGKVAKRRITNIRLSQLLSQNSKMIRKKTDSIVTTGDKEVLESINEYQSYTSRRRKSNVVKKMVAAVVEDNFNGNKEHSDQ
jgi:hypothetical protein